MDKKEWGLVDYIFNAYILLKLFTVYFIYYFKKLVIVSYNCVHNILIQ